MAEYLSGVRVEFVLDPLDGVGWVVVAAIWYDDILFSHLPLFLCSAYRARFSVPARTSETPARAGAVKAGRRSARTSRSIVSRPSLDSPEHGGSYRRILVTEGVRRQRFELAI